ncbi:hypothetical protein [Devosia sp.]|uniref:hypothetical protein n=1 Tax=Devosia sp. TaxID=1871048 RepID=UPI00292E7CA5|nr:hypothetical protein [Devosia sp.]
MPKKLPQSVPAKPYEPTEKELAAAARYKDRTDAAPPKPKLKITTTDAEGARNVHIEIDHPDPGLGWALLIDSLGAGSARVTEVVIDQVAALVQTKAGVNQQDANRMLALVQGIGPRDPIETMLSVQMAAIHMATIKQAQVLAGSLEKTSTYHLSDGASTALNKLARTFTTQMDALKRHRSKAEQRVIVEHQHVHVYPGGQAVVGNVTQGGLTEKEGQPHERQLRLSERAAVLGTIEADQVPVPSAGREGVERLPVPRGKGRATLRAVE